MVLLLPGNNKRQTESPTAMSQSRVTCSITSPRQVQKIHQVTWLIKGWRLSAITAIEDYPNKQRNYTICIAIQKGKSIHIVLSKQLHATQFIGLSTVLLLIHCLLVLSVLFVM